MSTPVLALDERLIPLPSSYTQRRFKVRSLFFYLASTSRDESALVAESRRPHTSPFGPSLLSAFKLFYPLPRLIATAFSSAFLSPSRRLARSLSLHPFPFRSTKKKRKKSLSQNGCSYLRYSGAEAFYYRSGVTAQCRRHPRSSPRDVVATAAAPWIHSDPAAAKAFA